MPESLHLPVGEMTFDVLADGPEDGRLVMLLHGFPQSAHEWRGQMSALAGAGCRAVAPNQRGYSPGARPLDVSAYAIDHLVADVLALADEIGAHQFDLVGHDWGGLIGWYVAGRYPQRVRTYTAISTPHPNAYREAYDGTVSTAQATAGAYVDFFRMPDAPEQAMTADGLRTMFVASGLSEADAEAHVGVCGQPGAVTAGLNWYRATHLKDVPHLAQVTVPTLYIWSTGDDYLVREAAEQTKAHVSGPYQFEVLEGVNHWVPEVAADEVNRLLLAHLDKYE